MSQLVKLFVKMRARPDQSATIAKAGTVTIKIMAAAADADLYLLTSHPEAFLQ